ncbi:MAG: L-2-hydroxyglutarate oxidase [marine benthic group bacterium]|nr:L-2-hydroxyglutarate oxidase [Gemmatimonadota bacterium]
MQKRRSYRPPETRHPDVLIVGAGAVGASVALHAARSGLQVLVVEKEAAPALHQSGRNSGVCHAGYNLKPGTQKAQFCVEGSRRLREWCATRGVPLEVGGILVVATRESELPTLYELKRRSEENGVRADLVGEEEIRSLEPHSTGLAALHAPEGASFDTEAFVRSVLEEAQSHGAVVQYGVEVHALIDGSDCARARTDRRAIEAGVAVNCAGLQADRVAGAVADDVRVIPFRGFYAELVPGREHLVRSHVYRAPDMAWPFLGVHASRRTDGRVLLGPGAMLAPGRESYGLLGIQAEDMAATLSWPGFRKLLRDRRFRRMAVSEVRKNFQLREIWKEAVELIPDLRPADLARSFAGNRAQLVRLDGTLVDDFLVRETKHCVHILNAVSPGLTGSLPFGEWVWQRAADLANGASRSGQGLGDRAGDDIFPDSRTATRERSGSAGKTERGETGPAGSLDEVR